jgi:hypothetical protein
MLQGRLSTEALSESVRQIFRFVRGNSDVEGAYRMLGRAGGEEVAMGVDRDGFGRGE